MNKIIAATFSLLFSAMPVLAAEPIAKIDSITVLYDSRQHQLSGSPKNFSVEKYDLSLTGRIEAQINKRLVYSGPQTSVEGVEAWARKKTQEDPELKRLFDMLPSSYDYLTPVSQMGLTKIPAVIAHAGTDNFVVYGETNIYKALQAINASRSAQR